MRWKRNPMVAVAAAMLWLSSGCPASAVSFYEPGPSPTVGITKPTIFQQFILGEGERFLKVDMTLDGKPVKAVMDDETGLVYYTPDEPLELGTHHVWMSVEVRHPRAREGYRWNAVVSEFAFEVVEDIEDLPDPTPEQLEILDYINSIRRQAGVAPVKWNSSLGMAASRHAEYMAVNNSYAHEEQEGKKLYTGHEAWDRAEYFGYAGNVVEDIHHIRDNRRAVDDWMAAPYHRFPIINPRVKECGFASYEDYQVLDCGLVPGQKQIVVWPYDGMKNVPLSWSGAERPSPLRLYPNVKPPVGYPITLQFGRAIDWVGIDEAYLKDAKGRKVALLTYSSENDDFLQEGIILIPREPYQPNTTYTVYVEGTVRYTETEEERFAYKWQFTTEAISQPVDTPDRDDRQQDEGTNKPDEKEDNAGEKPEREPPTDPGDGRETGEDSNGSNPSDRGNDTPAPPPVELKDISGHWAEGHIRRLVQAGIVNGYPDSTFRPEDSLTRAEFVKMLATALRLNPIPGTTGPFTGMQDHWFVRNGYFGAVLEAGIVRPEDYPGNRFDPDGKISREEIAVMIARAAGLTIQEQNLGGAGFIVIGNRWFTDASTWRHPAYIVAAIKAGLITGYPERENTFTFRPANPATRAEAVVMVTRLLDLRASLTRKGLSQEPSEMAKGSPFHVFFPMHRAAQRGRY